MPATGDGGAEEVQGARHHQHPRAAGRYVVDSDVCCGSSIRTCTHVKREGFPPPHRQLKPNPPTHAQTRPTGRSDGRRWRVASTAPWTWWPTSARTTAPSSPSGSRATRRWVRPCVVAVFGVGDGAGWAWRLFGLNLIEPLGSSPLHAPLPQRNDIGPPEPHHQGGGGRGGGAERGGARAHGGGAGCVYVC